MKTDKELLELAAKACGFNVKGVRVDHDDNFSGLIIGRRNTRERIHWNPIADDGDAFRLAVKLNLVVDFGENQVKVFFENKVSVSYNIRGDKADIARRAIVRAAAAVGEAL